MYGFRCGACGPTGEGLGDAYCRFSSDGLRLLPAWKYRTHPKPVSDPSSRQSFPKWSRAPSCEGPGETILSIFLLRRQLGSNSHLHVRTVGGRPSKAKAVCVLLQRRALPPVQRLMQLRRSASRTARSVRVARERKAASHAVGSELLGALVVHRSLYGGAWRSSFRQYGRGLE
jgi:hypothetical protein